jgi:DNA polymerase I-like protein with 3'-5' exonuclease and polymerase domains
MIAHHSAWAGLQKSLAFQASMYCNHYVYWKDDGKTWNPAATGEDQLWRYNCVDCVRTREVGEAVSETIEQLGLQAVDAFQQRMFWPVLQCMQRGIAIDKRLRNEFAAELMSEMEKREAFFYRVLGHTLNPRSSKQMTELFYGDLKQQPIFTPAKRGIPGHLSCDGAALEKIAVREPLLRPLIRAISEYRSLGVFLSTFVLAPLDIDGRMRTSYNICGTETYRFSSSENAFGSGTNLQNIPKGGDDDDTGLALPNVRKIFVPDPGYTIFDTDLSKADLRIVTWEADEPEMKAMLREGRDPYVEVAREFYKDPSIRKTNPDGSENPRYRTFKSFCHGTHYLGTPAGLAQRLGLTVHVAESTQRWYLGRFSRIREWQKEFCAQLRSRRYVQNIFGYRRYYFDRVDDATCREAIAWLPQSTVALYINRIWMAIYEQHPHIQILLQVHDSLVGQFPTWRKDGCLKQLAAASQITLPYPDPLIIPVGVKHSEVSWGAC